MHHSEGGYQRNSDNENTICLDDRYANNWMKPAGWKLGYSTVCMTYVENSKNSIHFLYMRDEMENITYNIPIH